MCIRDRVFASGPAADAAREAGAEIVGFEDVIAQVTGGFTAVSYTHLRAHETVLDLVCRLLLEKKKQNTKQIK